MKKTLLIFGMLLWSFHTLNAQKVASNVEVKWTKEKKSKKSFYPEEIFAIDKTGYYMRVSSGGAFNFKTKLLHYDPQFKLVKSAELKLGKGSKRRNFNAIVHLNDKLYLFTSYKNKKTRKHSLYLQTVDKKTLTPSAKPKKLATIDFAKKTKRNAGDYSIVISRDSTKVLVYYNLPYKKNEKEKFGFQVYDNNMNELWKKNVTLPYIDKLFIIEDFIVDNNGAVHVLGKVFNKKLRNKRKGKTNYKFQILSYYKDEDEVKKYDIRLKDKFINKILLTVNNDNNIICSGFYSDMDADVANGVFFLTIDGQTKQVLTESYKKFDADFLTQYLSKARKKRVKKRMAKGKKGMLVHYDLDDIVTKSDGGAVLIGEYYNVVAVTSTTTMNGVTTTRTTYYYYYGNIIAVNIAPDGQITWAKKVPKLQISINRPGYFASYAKMITDKHIYFIYNDNPKNLTTTKNQKGKIYSLRGPKKSIITLATIDLDGNLKREMIKKPEKSKLYITPRVCRQLNKKTMVLFGQRGKRYRFARLIFKD